MDHGKKIDSKLYLQWPFVIPFQQSADTCSLYKYWLHQSKENLLGDSNMKIWSPLDF